MKAESKSTRPEMKGSPCCPSVVKLALCEEKKKKKKKGQSHLLLSYSAAVKPQSDVW